MSRLPTIIVCAALLTGCGTASELSDDARSRADAALKRVDGARSRADEMRAQLDRLGERADELGDRATWCGAAARLGTALAARDAEAAQSAAEDLRDGAPAELADEIRTVLTATVRAQAGDPSVLLDAEVREAALVVLDEARTSCGGDG